MLDTLKHPQTGRPLTRLAIVQLSAAAPWGPLGPDSVRAMLDPARAPGCTLRTALSFAWTLRRAGWHGTLEELCPPLPGQPHADRSAMPDRSMPDRMLTSPEPPE